MNRVLLLMASLPSLMVLAPGQGMAQVGAPMIFYSDLESGPSAGGQNNAGAFVTVYGKRFGSARGTSKITVGGGEVAAYPVWSDQKVTFQLGAAAASGNIVVTTASGSSNGIAFTVRSGSIYFVSTSGSDSNPGSFASPWRSLLKARDTIRAGDIAYAMNGVSQPGDDGQGWGTSFLLRSGGTPGMPMALVAYPGATASIGSVTGPSYGVRVIDNGSNPGNWVFAGLTLRGGNSAMVLGGPSINWRIIGNDMSCPNGNGEVGCFATSKASYVSFHGNNLHDAGVANASSHYHGVYWSTDSNHLDMGWNTIANIHGCRGIQTHSSPLGSGGVSDPTGYNLYDIDIHDNVIHDTQCDGVILATVDPSKGKIEVRNNIIYNAGKGPNNPENTGAWTCVNVPGTTANGAAGGGTVEVYNNTMYNCGSFATPPYQNANAAVENGGNNTNLKIQLRNNILYQTSATPYLVIYGPSDGIRGTNNIFYGNGAAPSNSNLSASLNANPMFVNAAAGDFHLTSGSPADGAGTTTSQAYDFDGVPQPQSGRHSIGAFSYSTGGAQTVTVSVTPSAVSLTPNQQQQFSAAVGGSPNSLVTWSVSPAVGGISTSGLYTAPASISAQQTLTVTATSVADGTKSATATVTLNPVVALTLTPTAVTLGAGQTRQFTATVSGSSNTGVTWSMTPSVGTLSAAGLYTAPASLTSAQTVVVTATSVADTTKSASATISLAPTVAISLTPASASLRAGAAQQFAVSVSGTSNTGVTWSMTPAVGSLSAAGLYTAPASLTSAQTVVVTATSVADTTKSASATISLAPTVVVGLTPAAVSLRAGAAQQFAASVSGTGNTSVTWSMTPAVGTLSAAGLYTAPASITAAQTVVVTATSAADATKSASATISLVPTVTVSLTPASVTLPAGATQQFAASVSGSANTAVTWTLSPATGTVSSTGLYTAPALNASMQTVTVTATAAADPTKSASATVTIGPALSSNPFQVSWVQLSPTQYQINWKAPAGQPDGDWIAISGVGAPAWWYTTYQLKGPGTSGSFVINAPATPGQYEIRYNLKGVYTTKAVSTAMNVGTTVFSLTPRVAATLGAGTSTTVSWTVPTGRPSSDSVGLYLVGAPNDAPVWRDYPKSATGSFTVPVPTTPGKYEFRWRIGYLAAARSSVITVK